MKLFCFGYGQSAAALARRGGERFFAIAGTVRSAEKAARLREGGIAAFRFGDGEADDGIRAALHEADAVLISIPPGPDGDPALRHFADALAAAPRLLWIGYFSTIGVYGDHGGAWIDETAPLAPHHERARRRVEAERGWLALGERSGKAVQIFRLGGIYGPGSNALASVANGTARRLVKPGQVFNRVHVDDIAGAVLASMARPRAGGVYNVVDDEPAPPQDVITHAASLLGVAPPPEQPFDPAVLSPMAAEFYGQNKRVSNRLLKDELGWRPLYPTYRDGLGALHGAGEGARAA